MASTKTTFWASILGSAVIAASVSAVANSRLEAFKAEQNKELEKYKLELQNQNSALTKIIAVHSLLAERLDQFSDELNNYVRVVQIASQSGRNGALLQEARRSWTDLSERMAELEEVRKRNAIAPALSEQIDTVLLAPVSRSLATVQQQPHNNPALVRLYNERLRQEISEIRKTIKDAENHLTL